MTEQKPTAKERVRILANLRDGKPCYHRVSPQPYLLGWIKTMLTENEIRKKIKAYCIEQDGCDLRDARALAERILGLCEALGVEDTYRGLSKGLLEHAGIKVKEVNPLWGFE